MNTILASDISIFLTNAESIFNNAPTSFPRNPHGRRLSGYLSVGINWQTLYKNYYVIIKLLK